MVAREDIQIQLVITVNVITLHDISYCKYITHSLILRNISHIS